MHERGYGREPVLVREGPVERLVVARALLHELQRDALVAILVRVRVRVRVRVGVRVRVRVSVTREEEVAPFALGSARS